MCDINSVQLLYDHRAPSNSFLLCKLQIIRLDATSGGILGGSEGPIVTAGNVSSWITPGISMQGQQKPVHSARHTTCVIGADF